MMPDNLDEDVDDKDWEKWNDEYDEDNMINKN